MLLVRLRGERTGGPEGPGGGAAHAREPAEVATLSGVIVQGANTGSLLGAPVMAIAVTLLGGWEQGYWVMILFGTIGTLIAVGFLRGADRIRGDI